MTNESGVLFETIKDLEKRLNAVQAAFGFIQNPETVVLQTLALTLERTEADAGIVVRANELAGVFERVVTYGKVWGALETWFQGKTEKIFSVPLTDGWVGRAFQTLEPVIVCDPLNDPLFQTDFLHDLGQVLSGVLVVPLQTNGQRRGAMVLYKTKKESIFSPQNVETAVLLGSFLSVFMGKKNLPVSTPVVLPPATDGGTPLAHELKRTTREAQTQLEETRLLLDTALSVQKQNKECIASLTQEVEKWKALAHGPKNQSH